MKLLFVLCIFLFSCSGEFKAKVVSTTWKTTTVLLLRETRRGSHWDRPDEVTAFNVTHSLRQDGFVTCSRSCTKIENYKCKRTDKYYGRTTYDTCYGPRNTTCLYDCPNMRMWAEFDYYHWVEKDKQEKTGHSLDVQWVEFQILEEGAKIEKTVQYEIEFSNGQKTWFFHPTSLTEYQKFKSGEDWIIDTGFFSTVPRLRLTPTEIIK